MMTAGRFEEAGHRLCRWTIVLLSEEDDVFTPPTDMWYVWWVVAAAWAFASPAIYGGRVLDMLSGATTTCSDEDDVEPVVIEQ